MQGYWAYYLGGLAALAFLVRLFFKKPSKNADKRKRGAWVCELVAYALLVMVAILNRPGGAENDSGAADCSTEEMVKHYAIQDKATARQLAECIIANDAIVRDALDSAALEGSIGKLDKALTHVRYAIAGAITDSAKSRAYFFRGITYDLIADSLSFLGNNPGMQHHYTLALHSYDTAITLGGENAALWSNRSLTLVRLGQNHAALV